MIPRYAVVVALAVLSFADAQATVRNVPADYPTIQASINASANGDTVLVGPGLYLENIVFRGKRIAVVSRYAVTGDPTSIQNTIINGSTPSHPDSGSCVRIVNGEDSTAVLQGFTLTGGYGTLWDDEHGPGNRYWEGGGVLIALSSPTIKNNIISNNNVNRTGGVSTGGGGIRLGDGAPRILNNIIMNNAGMYGGGIVSNFASPIIRNNVIANNVVSSAVSGLPTYGGGGLWFNGGVAGNRIENNTIVGNSATGSGGSGAGGRGGGMIAVFGATINTRNNIVWGNTQTTGGQVGTASGTALVSYTDVEGGFTGTGNINAPPLFADTSFYLQATSPCIDVGDTSAAFNDPPDPGNPGFAKWPAQGGLRNDIGAYGGPLSGIIACILTSVSEQGVDVPVHYELSQNYPNPFNPQTTIRYSVPQREIVHLQVFDVLGREVATLVNEEKPAGEYTIRFDGNGMSSGTYLYRLTVGSAVAAKRMIYLR